MSKERHLEVIGPSIHGSQYEVGHPSDGMDRHGGLSYSLEIWNDTLRFFLGSWYEGQPARRHRTVLPDHHPVTVPSSSGKNLLGIDIEDGAG